MNRKTERLDWLTVMVMVAIVAIIYLVGFLVTEAHGGTYNDYIVLNPGIYADSCLLKVYYRGSRTIVDSQTVGGSGWPDSMALSGLDSAKYPYAEPWYYSWGSDTATLFAEDVIPLGIQQISAVASVDYGQIADSIRSILPGAGSGANAWTIFSAQSADTSGISRSLVSIYDMAGGEEGRLYTNSSGVAAFTVDLDSFSVRISKSGTGYVQDSPYDTIVVASDGQRDTVYGTFVDLSIPAAGATPMATLIVYYTRDGAPVSGVTFRARNENAATDTVNDVIIGLVDVKKSTDSTGLSTLSVPRSYVYHDSLLSLFDITLSQGNREIYQWSDFYVANQDTVRMTIED